MSHPSQNKIAWSLAVGVTAIVIFGAGAYTYRHRNEISQNRLQADLPEAITFEEIEEEAEPLFTLPLEREEEAVTTDDIAKRDPSASSADAPVAQDDARDVMLLDNTSLARVNYAVPFTSQAPHANWDLPYQEACEEASVLMAVAFFDGDRVDISTRDAADAEILSLVDFQTQRYGEYLDTTAEETIRFARAKYEHIQFDLLRNPTIADIRSKLSGGSLVIVPAYGRALGNPNFTGDGPLYHMLVVRGFDSNRRTFITNDPGTRNGESYVYNEDVIMSAMGDWNDGDPQNGEKVIIIVSSPVR